MVLVSKRSQVSPCRESSAASIRKDRAAKRDRYNLRPRRNEDPEKQIDPTLRIGRVAIIGAGVAGVAAAKYLLDENIEVVIYEQRDRAGGLWNLTAPDARFVTATYEAHESNVPHALMTYSDLPWDRNAPLFAGRDDVANYVQRYTQVNDLATKTKFNTEVLDISRSRRKWKVKSEEVYSRAKQTELFDAVVVASGVNNKPKKPDFPGLDEWIRRYGSDTVSHSQTFRNAEPYRNKTVLLIGLGPSGRDILRLIRNVATRVIASGPLQPGARPPTASGSSASLVYVGPAESFIPSDVDEGRVKFSAIDGIPHFEHGIDMVIVCTGYVYDFPFFKPRMQSQLLSNRGNDIKNLYEHIFYIPNPTLAFVGMSRRTSQFVVAPAQGAVIARVFSGRIGIESRRAMRDWQRRPDTKTLEQIGLGKEEAKYVNLLFGWSMGAFQSTVIDHSVGKVPPCWDHGLQWNRDVQTELGEAYMSQGEQRLQCTRAEELGFVFPLAGKLGFTFPKQRGNQGSRGTGFNSQADEDAIVEMRKFQHFEVSF